MAVELCADDLADLLDPTGIAVHEQDVEAAKRALTFATELIRDYLRGAYESTPATICDNACVRVCAYLLQSPATLSSRLVTSTRGALMEPGQRPAEFSYGWSVDHSQATAHALRQSGAQSLLSRYKVRRAL